MSLVAMRLRGVANSVRRRPLRYLLGIALLALVSWGLLAATRWGVGFVDRYPAIGTIADAALQRSVEALFLVLMLGVAFSVLSTAIATLYGSSDLGWLLSLPLAPGRVFALKTAETYLSAAFLPALFTLPILLGLGLERAAPLGYYPIALAAVLALYGLPVALGALLALALVRVAPLGRVKEVATALSVLLAAALVLGLRVLRPEQLAELTPEEFETFLAHFATLEVGWLPSSWASQAVWGALEGEDVPGAFVLAAVSLALLVAVAKLAAWAYQQGWVRSLESGALRLDPRRRPASAWECGLYRLGRAGAVIAKDLRLLLRDPSQWSQLLVLLALAAVYMVSVGSIAIEGQRFKDALGTLNLMVLAFLLAGVGIRTAYPLVSLEGEGFWLLKTAPLGGWQFALAKFWGAWPPLALLGGGLGYATGHFLDLSPTLAFASPVAGLLAATAIAALGVGLGAAFPRFDAVSPAEIPLSPGGILYMAAAFAYAAFLTFLLAYPAWQALTRPSQLYWAQPEGQLLLAATACLTLLAAWGALSFGARRLERYQAGE